MADANTREELEAEWWGAWWDADYSWEGIASHRITGLRGLNDENSLQDYWRRKPDRPDIVRDDQDMIAEGELVVAPDGRLWHIAHAPLFWKSGNSAKSEWKIEEISRLENVISARIAVAQETVATINILGEEYIFGIDGRTQLQGAVLLSQILHPDGHGKPIHIAADRSWLPDIIADDYKFGPGANFNQAYFFGESRFNCAIFEGTANFSFSIFANGADFGGSKIEGDACFTGAKFSKIAFFKKAIFSGKVLFHGTLFDCSVNFSETFLKSDAVFTSIMLNDDIYFYKTKFSGVTNFSGSKFSSTSDFQNAVFLKSVDFSLVDFRRGKNLSPGKLERVNFAKVVFTGFVDFEYAVFTGNPAHHSAAFLGARFEDLVSFRGCGDHWVGALDEAEIKGRILIDELDEMDALREFDTIVLPLARSGGENLQTGKSLLKELEGGCRTIKVAMGTARNEIMEQRYYRFQLRARREQAGVPRSERLISHLFGFAADYGLSIWRPTLGLIMLVIFFTAIYGALKSATLGAALDASQLGDALLMSLSRIFPFGAFEGISSKWIDGVLTVNARLVRESGWSIAVRSLASLQSLLALLLIFLFGLAVRRRFKVGE